MAAPKVKKLKLKKGDEVVVIAGKDAGKKGKITEVSPKTGKVYVEGVNIIKKHTKPTRTMPQGGILDQEAPIDSSNVMVYCSKCKAAVRVGKNKEDGKSVRICKKCGVALDK
ncbi:large subunit ribosomal protein L24 [Desulfitispora alkaliphila]|uniref:50S ribosomal protein L24 n=1 Tax=Desulfitispora alkaliphila TaxID=622674 RepID=UPI003D1F1469